MDTSAHTIVGLFEQLGLGNSQKDVEQFIAKHGGLSPTTPLTEADFFNDSQKMFLTQEWTKDSEWVAAIDELDMSLR